MSELIRLSICDCKTGFCIFDLVWNENYVVIPTSVGALISSFYQIGREFGDKGGVSSILMRPCSHKELFANSSFGASFNNFTDSVVAPPRSPPQLSTTRSASFPSPQVPLPPLSPRDRTSSPASFLLSADGKVNLGAVGAPLDASSSSSSSSSVPPSPPLTVRASSLPTLPRKDPSMPGLLAHSRSLSPPSPPIRPRSPSNRSRPLLAVSTSPVSTSSTNLNHNNTIIINNNNNNHSSNNSHGSNNTLSDSSNFTDSFIAYNNSDSSSTSSNSAPNTPVTNNPPQDPFTNNNNINNNNRNGTVNFNSGDSDSDTQSTITKSTSSPPSPIIHVVSPSPQLPDRISRLLQRKRRAKSTSAVMIRLTLDRDGELVVAVMHVDNSRVFEFAKNYANTILKEFVDVYGLELLSLRNTLDKYGDTPPPEVAADILEKFKEFCKFAENIKEIPKYSSSCFSTTLYFPKDK